MSRALSIIAALILLALPARAQFIIDSYRFGGLDADALLYRDLVVAAGGTLTTPQLNAVNAFVVSNKVSGVWPYLRDCSPFLGGTTNAQLVKLKWHPLGLTNPTNLTTSGTPPTWSASKGWTFNGSSQFLDTRLFQSNTVIGLGTNGMAVFVTHAQTNNSGGVLMGADYVFPVGHYMLYTAPAASTDWYHSWNSYHKGVLVAPSSVDFLFAPNGENFYHEVSTNATDSRMVMNGEVVATSGTTQGSADGMGRILIGAAGSTSGTGGSYWSGSIGYYGVDDGIPHALQDDYYGAVRNLMSALGRLELQTNTTERMLVPVTGQSLAIGTSGTSSGTIANQWTSYGNKMGGGSFISAYSTTNSARARSVESRFVTGWLGFQEQLSKTARSGSEGDSYDSVLQSHGYGGYAYASLKTNTAPYNELLAWVRDQDGYEQTTFGRNAIVSVVPVVHGEADSGLTTYDTSLEEWQRSMEIDIRAITGQTNRVQLLHSQSASYGFPSNLTAYAVLDQLQAHENSGGSNLLVMPKYFLDHASDGIHLATQGYQIMGEYYGKAAYKLLSAGTTELALRPLTAAMADSDTVILTTTGRVGNLVIEGSGAYNAWLTKANAGFTFTNDAGPISISSVYLTNSSTQIAIELAAAYNSGANPKLRYALNATTPDAAGTTAGPSGNVHDSDAAVGAMTGTNLWNWLVAFEKTVTAPPTPLLAQGFEGTAPDYDNSESWTTLGDGNPNSTANVYAGSQSFVHDPSTSGTRSPDFTAVSSVTFTGTFYSTALPASNGRSEVSFRSAGGTTVRAYMEIKTTGDLYIQHGTVSEAVGVTISTATRYYVKLVYTQGSGSNGTLAIHINTTGFTFGAADHTITTGDANATVECGQIAGNSTSQGTAYWDTVTITTP